MSKACPRSEIFAVFTFFILFLCACSSTLNQTPVQSDSEDDLILTASFQRQDGAKLHEMYADFCSGQMQDTSLLDEQGTMKRGFRKQKAFWQGQRRNVSKNLRR